MTSKESPFRPYPRSDWSIRLHNKAWVSGLATAGIGALMAPFRFISPEKEVLGEINGSDLGAVGFLLLFAGLLAVQQTGNGNQTVKMYRKRISEYRKTGTVRKRYKKPFNQYCYKVGGELAAKDIRTGKT